MSEADVFYMLIMQRRQQRENNNSRSRGLTCTMLYGIGRRGRGRGICTLTLLLQLTQVLLRNVGLLKYYEEATSLKGHSGFLVQLIHRWDVHHRLSVSVLISGTIPLRRIFILSLGYLGEGRIFPSSLMSQWVLQLRVNSCTLRDILGLMYFLQ
jgi:hypothetical protein